MQRIISLRSFLIILLVTLIIMSVILLYLYYILSSPPGPSAVHQSEHLKHLFSIYGYGVKDREMLSRPSDVAFDSDGNIYIADTGHARILVFRPSGQYLREIGRNGADVGELTEPVGITVSKNGRVYVADKALNKIVIYESTGRFKSEFKVEIPLKPYIANGKLYVTTYGHVIIYDLQGRELDQWGQKGRREGEMDSPTGIVVNKDGRTYVSDTLNLRVQAFSREGKVLWVKGKPAKDIKAADRRFGLPCGIALDEKGLLYLIDAFDHSIKVLNKDGRQIAVLSRRGNKEGELNLPSGIAYDQKGVFAIADKYNDRVQVVKITIKYSDYETPRTTK